MWPSWMMRCSKVVEGAYPVERRYPINVVLTALIVLNTLFILASLGSVRRDISIPATAIRVDQGKAFFLHVNALAASFPLTVYSDSIRSPRSSTLELLENGVGIGPAHAPHHVIRETGSGAYSHWRGVLFFSTSDGSDPRQAPSTYTVHVDVTLHPSVVALTLALTFAVVSFHFRNIKSAGRRRFLDRLMLGALALFAVILAAVAADLLPTLNHISGPPKNAALILAILGHLCLGVLLFVVSVILAAACGQLQFGRLTASLPKLLLAGYPGALLVLAAASAVALTTPLGSLLGTFVLLLGCTPLLFGASVSAREIAELACTVAKIIPAAFAFAAFMALLWHGPTATLSASTQGDLVHSYASLNVLGVAPWPLRHFGSEGDFLPYDNMLPMAIGATLSGVPGFDGLIFLTASIGVFFAMWLGLGIACLRRISGEALPPMLGACLVLLTLAAVRTPSFVVESPPVPFMAPLLLSFAFLAQRNVGQFVASVSNAVIVAISTGLTKVVMIVPLGFLIMYDAIIDLRWRRLSLVQISFIAIATLLIGVYVTRTLAVWGAVYLHAFVPGPDIRIWLTDGKSHDLPSQLIVAARDVGWCVLAYAVIKSGPPRMAVACIAAVTLNFVYPYLFHTTAVFAPLLVAATLALEPRRFERVRHVLLIAALLLLPYPVLRDWAGVQSGIIWVFCIGQITLIVAPSLAAPAPRQWFSSRIPLLTAAIAAMTLTAVGGGLAVIDSGWRQGKADILTASMYDIWHAVRRETSTDALIFTDQTGSEFRVASGWNSYVATGHRQVFIASWVTSFRRFRVDPDARATRLQQNTDVLEGRKKPDEIPLSRTYDSYFAVIAADKSPPPGFRRLYANEDFALYRIGQ